jgi:hypothetical protein
VRWAGRVDRDQTSPRFPSAYYFRCIHFFAKDRHRVDIGAEETSSDSPPVDARIMRNSSLALVALLATATAAYSQSLIPDLNAAGTRGEMARAEKKKAEARFDAMDGNKDGKLSKDEVMGKSEYLASNFDKLDGNKDGSLSWEEFLGHTRWPK